MSLGVVTPGFRDSMDVFCRRLALRVALGAVRDIRSKKADYTVFEWITTDGLVWLDLCGITLSKEQLLEGLSNNPRSNKKRIQKERQADPLEEFDLED